MKDSEIIDLYFSRDERAISETEAKYGKYCQAVSYNILQNREDCEECLNDTYLAAWNRIPPDRPEHLSTYLGKIARNLAIDRYRCYNAEKRRMTQTAIALTELEDCIPDPAGYDSVTDEMNLTGAINTFLYAQKEEKRSVFICRYWQMMPVRDIAEKYGLSEGKVTSILHRMRKDLRSHLEKEGIYL